MSDIKPTKLFENTPPEKKAILIEIIDELLYKTDAQKIDTKFFTTEQLKKLFSIDD